MKRSFTLRLAGRLGLICAAVWSLTAGSVLLTARNALGGASGQAEKQRQAARNLEVAVSRKTRDLARLAAKNSPASAPGGGSFVDDMNHLASVSGASLTGARLDEPAPPSPAPPSSDIQAVAPPPASEKAAPKFHCTVSASFPAALAFLDGVADSPSALQIDSLEASCANAAPGAAHPSIQMTLSGATPARTSGRAP